jgi:hypothetical protein
VLPPVSKLTMEQAMYHFISGYTAKVAGACRADRAVVWFGPCMHRGRCNRPRGDTLRLLRRPPSDVAPCCCGRVV